MEGEAEVSVLGGTVPLGRKEREKERDIINKSKVKCASMFCNTNIYFCNFFSSVRFYFKLPSFPVLYVFSNTSALTLLGDNQSLLQFSYSIIALKMS